MDRKSQSLISDIKQTKQQLEELKSSQPIAGDSWVPYRYEGSFTMPANSNRYIIFTVDDPTRAAVVRVNEELDQTPYSTGWRSQGGVYCFMQLANNFASYTKRYVIYSTQKGTVSISSNAPF